VKQLWIKLRGWAESIIVPLCRVWRTVAASYSLLEPVRWNALLVVAMAVAFLAVPQGRDLLTGLAEDVGDGQRRWAIVGLFASITYFCLTNWFWPRFLLNCDFGVEPTSSPLSTQAQYQLRLHVPRVLGVAPASVIAVSFWWNRVPGELSDVFLAGGALALSVGLYWGLMIRRKIVKVALNGSGTNAVGQPAAPGRFTSLENIGNDREARFGIVLFGGPPAILFFLFASCPVWTGQVLGSSAVVLLGLAGLGCFGAGLVYFGHRYELPILGMLLLLAWIAHFNNDNHEVRHLAGVTEGRELLEDRLNAWHEHVQKVDAELHATSSAERPPHPLFIVATEGGGIRAAYWTALVLSSLEDASVAQGGRRFSDHLFAVSGVSGGSFGGSIFTGFVAAPMPGACVNRTQAMMMDKEFLAPLVGRLLYTDFLQRFVPLRLPWTDRAESFELAWENAWRDPKVNNGAPGLFAESFTGLYRRETAAGVWLPGLFLNSTCVETGGRIVTSGWDYRDGDGTTFVGAIDGITKVEAPMSVATAAHASARFTYFNPPGRYPSGSHFVDGGYFENSGGQTARDILARVLRKKWVDKSWQDVEPRLIIIRNGLDKELSKDEKARIAGEKRNNFALSELLAPPETLWNTRTARAESALAELENQSILTATQNPHESPPPQAGMNASPRAQDPQFRGIVPHHGFALLNSAANVPLGWALSHRAIKEMHNQLQSVPTNHLAAEDVLKALDLQSTSKSKGQ
jgi:hypothetical protein